MLLKSIRFLFIFFLCIAVPVVLIAVLFVVGLKFATNDSVTSFAFSWSGLPIFFHVARTSFFLWVIVYWDYVVKFLLSVNFIKTVEIAEQWRSGRLAIAFLICSVEFGTWWSYASR
jgi:ethanolamine transporter EutH